MRFILNNWSKNSFQTTDIYAFIENLNIEKSTECV